MNSTSFSQVLIDNNYTRNKEWYVKNTQFGIIEITLFSGDITALFKPNKEYSEFSFILEISISTNGFSKEILEKIEKFFKL